VSNQLSSKSLQDQQLISIVAKLLPTRNIGLNANHIPGVDNILADYISRLSHSAKSITL
jgi:hypothetical protein